MTALGWDSKPSTRLRWFLLAASGWIFVLGISYWRYRGPVLVTNPRDVNEFNGTLGEEILKRLVGNNTPHPAGSADHNRVRNEIISLAETAGYDVELQATRFEFAQTGGSIPLVNILFRLKGNGGSGRAAMLVAHYDSAPQAPGAGDDGVGVAALLEIARTLKTRGGQLNDVVFLITDGEESGLLGAQKFCEEHPWAKDIEACVNLEARGTSGPSLMFQTGVPNGWLVELMGSHLRRPFTSSLFFEIYRRLPNDTDFTVFQKHGINGFNFAFIGEIKNYHTPGDNIANISRASLQHHGDNALQTILGLANCDWKSRRTGDAVYFDLFGCGLCWWPAEWTLPWSIVVLVVAFLLSCWNRASARGKPFFPALFALALTVVTIILAALVGWGVGALLALDGAFQSPWPSNSFALVMAFWLAAIGAVSIVSRIPWGWLESETILIGSLLLWASWSILASWFVVGSSYLFLVPATVLALGLLLARVWKNRIGMEAAAVAFCLATGVIWISQEGLFYDALGFRFPWLVAARAALTTSTLLPLLAGMERRRGWWIAAAALLALLVASAVGILSNRLIE